MIHVACDALVPGWVYDITGSYDLSFYLAGVFIGASGLVLFVRPLYLRVRTARTARAAPDAADAADAPNGHVKLNGKLTV